MIDEDAVLSTTGAEVLSEACDVDPVARSCVFRDKSSQKDTSEGLVAAKALRTNLSASASDNQ